MIVPGPGVGRTHHRVSAGGKIGGTWAAPRPSTSSSRTIKLSLLSRMASTVANAPELISRSTVPAEGRVDCIQVGEPCTRAATGAGKRGIQRVAESSEPVLHGCGLPPLEIVTEHVVAAGRKVAEDLQAVAAPGSCAEGSTVRYCQRQCRLRRNRRQQIAGGVQQVYRSGKSPLTALTLTVPASVRLRL